MKLPRTRIGCKIGATIFREQPPHIRRSDMAPPAHRCEKANFGIAAHNNRKSFCPIFSRLPPELCFRLGDASRGSAPAKMGQDNRTGQVEAKPESRFSVSRASACFDIQNHVKVLMSNPVFSRSRFEILFHEPGRLLESRLGVNRRSSRLLPELPSVLSLIGAPDML